ncbi:hypothetical protein D9615_004178 [Tricholomella constricta]|uniref:Uncharacterized protein n=1 Tax=Tricholomella constricta TaxID=117010 RepID=A0A8H5M4Y6_9AGAR|nr:hypothetical protein D9615_004178 [Tricholomella constricta]
MYGWSAARVWTRSRRCPILVAQDPGPTARSYQARVEPRASTNFLCLLPPQPHNIPMTIQIDSATAAEMRRIDNSPGCTITIIKCSTDYKGHLLAKDDGTYTTWARDFENHLVLTGLWEYAFDPPLRPHETHEPRAFRNWNMNDRLTCAFIATGVASAERQFILKEGAKACWLAIKGRHEGSGPVQQVQLLQEALSTKCSMEEPLTETIDRIFEKIDRAFAVGEVSSDTLKCIACLSSLSATSFAHARSNISRDIAASTKDKPYKSGDIRRYLENEQTLITADKADTNPPASAFSAKAQSNRNNRTSDLNCSTCAAAGRPAKGHTTEWCIMPGGGQAGKTIQESRTARHAAFEANRRNKGKTTPSKITITPSGGTAFSIEGDTATIAAYIAAQSGAKPEFAGLASDALPDTETCVVFNGAADGIHCTTIDDNKVLAVAFTAADRRSGTRMVNIEPGTAPCNPGQQI